ncbi:MAG: hypothetical protein FT714_20300, partial [Pantoea sp. Pent]|nr:hypothetical protein [Pantoea sp. Pent]
WWYSTTVGVIDLKKKSITMGKGCEKVFTMSPNTCLPCPRTVQARRRGKECGAGAATGWAFITGVSLLVDAVYCDVIQLASYISIWCIEM